MSAPNTPEVQRVVSMIEAWLSEAGIDPSRVYVDDTTADTWMRTWAVAQGSATVFINLQSDEDDDEAAYLHIYAPILTLPVENREAFYYSLLKRNFDSLTGCAFSIDENDHVTLTADRSTPDMSLEEFSEIVSYLASFADYYDNVLSRDFGAQMIGSEE